MISLTLSVAVISSPLLATCYLSASRLYDGQRVFPGLISPSAAASRLVLLPPAAAGKRPVPADGHVIPDNPPPPRLPYNEVSFLIIWQQLALISSALRSLYPALLQIPVSPFALISRQILQNTGGERGGGGGGICSRSQLSESSVAGMS